MAITAHFYAMSWTRWRRDQPPGALPDIDALYKDGVIDEVLAVSRSHQEWIQVIDSRRGHNKRWNDHLDALAAYARCREHLSPTERARIDPMVGALLDPFDGEHCPRVYKDSSHLLYPPQLVEDLLELEVDIAPVEAAMSLGGGMPFDVFEAILQEWLVLLDRVSRLGADQALLVWIWR